jgi:PAS domain S-box-containing protein
VTHPFLRDGGAAAELIASLDWSATPLGPIGSWPQSLTSIVGTIVHSRHPMFLWWGPELIQIYNDAYTPSFGRGKHPAAMGQRGRECWAESWAIIGPQIDDVMSRGRSTWSEDALVPVFRNGRIEDVYWTYGYSPVFAEDASVGGTLVVCTETTARVLGERRQAVLRAVVERTALATDRAAVAGAALEALAGAADVAGAAAWRHDRASGRARRAAAIGPDLAAPDDGPLAARVEAMWSRGDRTEGPLELPGSGGPVLLVAWSGGAGHATREALAFALNPRLSLDESYRAFLLQIADHVALAAARVEAFLARAAAEAERNDLLRKAPVASALLAGPDHVFQLANPLYCELVGRREEQLVGRSYRAAFPELAGTGLYGVLDRVFATGERYVSEEQLIPLARAPGGAVDERYVRFNLEAVRDADGAVSGIMAVAVDLTEQVAARRALERAGRAKDEFLAMLGHELRNPFGAIAAAVAVLDAPGAEEGSRARALDVLRRQVGTVTRLLDDLLDVARITRGRVELRPERVDLRDVAARAVEVVRPALDARRHALSLALSTYPVPVMADPTRLEQVLVNLLSNAAKYTPPGGRVALAVAADDGEAVARVADTGAGIAPSMLPHVFDLFVQAERTIDRAEGGLGLGLTLVRALVEMHGGRVSARSDGPGAGSEFVVRLPLLGPGPASAPRPAAPATPSPLRLLVVDDNVDIAEMMTEVLAGAGHSVAVAHDGFGALEAARSRPDVVLLDLGMPGIDGLEVCRRLRADPAQAGLTLVALSGYGQPDDRAETAAAGFDHHLVKPVDFAALDRILAAAPRR